MKKINILLTGCLCVLLIINAYSQSIVKNIINSRPPETYKAPEYIPDQVNGDVYLQNTPKYDWSYGCAPTAAAMLVGYYDWHNYDDMYTGSSGIGTGLLVPQSNIAYWGSGHCPLSATEIGYDDRLDNGHVEDYWGYPDPFIQYNWEEHTWGDCTADFMGTSQDFWNNDVNGNSTLFTIPSGQKVHDYTGHESNPAPQKDLCHGLRQFIESRGYTVLQNYNQQIWFSGMPYGFTFDNYKNEIDNDRPVLLHLLQSNKGHTMIGVGYNNNGNKVIVHDTWDNTTHEMVWAGSYGSGNNMYDSFAVSVIKLQEVSPGIDDYVLFINSPPNSLELNNLYQYEAQFISQYGNSNPIWWEFSLVLYHSTGEYQLFFEHEDETYMSNYWYVNIPASLPQHNWIRNENGNIEGHAKVEVMDSDGYGHYEEIEIQLLYGPPMPQIVGASVQNNSLFLSYITMGATSYEIFYDINSGHPYNGTGAIQGDSPINASNLTTFEISGLQSCTPYYFAVKAYNAQGESAYSSEEEIVILEPNNPGQNISYYLYDYVVQYNMDWTNDKYFKGNLVIQSGMTLTISDAVIYFEENSKIIIEPGGKLILDGTTCTAPCNQTWMGIEVWGDPDAHQLTIGGVCAQGIIELKGEASIENAVIGVLLGAKNENGTFDNSKNGGIIKADFIDIPEIPVANFLNNQRSVYFRKYQNKPSGKETANLSFIENCTFEVNQDYLMGDWWHSHIYMSEVYGIRIRGNTFVNNEVNVPSGHGINSYRAGFRVEAICDDIVSPCPETSLVKNTFTNFTKGINLIYAGPYTITVKDAEFYNNSNGVILSSVNNATVLFNEFFLGKASDDDDQKCDGKGAAYGIDLTNCTGFAVEENKFYKATGAPLGNYMGIRVTDCPSESDVIYLNEFYGVSVGNQAEGNNRSGDANTGITYFCNKNLDNNLDFYVADMAKIGGYMGDGNNPSGNTFSYTPIKFQNDYVEPIIYYYNIQEPDEVLDYNSCLGPVFPVGIDYENTCPSHYGGGAIPKSLVLSPEQKLEAEQDYASNLTDYNNVKVLFDNLKDGGNTEALKTEVETAWPNDMWELRAELLGKSPHLSMEVLKKAADKTDVLPESVLFEILSANPDELKKEELIKYLEDKENPLPAYMVDILKQLANGSSYKTVLLSEMASYHAKKVGAAQIIIRSVLNGDEPNMNELRNWLDNIGGLEADKQIIETYMAENDYNAAQSLLDMLPALYGLSGESLLEYDDYKSFMQLVMNLDEQGRTIFDLSDTELASLVYLAENGSGGAKTSAQGILEFAYGYDYCNCPDLPENIQLKSSTINLEKLAKARGLEISAEPNPVSTWAALNYTLPLSETAGVIEITDNSGRTIQQIKVTQQQGQYVLDTRNYKSGIYYYTLTCGDLLRTGKLIVK